MTSTYRTDANIHNACTPLTKPKKKRNGVRNSGPRAYGEKKNVRFGIENISSQFIDDFSMQKKINYTRRKPIEQRGMNNVCVAWELVDIR